MSKRGRSNNLTSEVGSNPNASASDMWREFFAQQHNNMMDMIRSLQGPTERPVQKVVFPKFDASALYSDAASWCATAEVILDGIALSGSALIMSLSAAFSGEASQWLIQVCYPEITWGEFKKLFLDRFGSQDTSAAEVIKVLKSRPNPGESLAAFGTRVVTNLEAKWKTKPVQEIAVAVVLASLTSVDPRLQRLAYTTEIKTRVELQHELMAYSFANEQISNVDEQPSKKFKTLNTIKCHYCGKLGHKLAECRARKEQEKKNISNQQATPVRKITCFKCGEEGHIASKCPTKRTMVEKRVDALQIVEPRGIMLHNGKSFDFYFDSGAECSLMKETMAVQFVGKRQHEIISLRGIGNNLVYSSTQLLISLKISNFNLEILFHIVTDNFLKYNVMIGREVLGMGFEVVTTLKEFQFIKSSAIGVFSIESQAKILNEVNTDLVDADKKRLLTLLVKYIDTFICGFPKKRVTTGQLEIRLIDNSKTVQRRPYRLSDREREVVRNRVNELILANVVRPSCSPFASPVLLVKKKNGADRLCVDFRELNANTISDKYPLPLIKDQIARLKGAKYFTCLDMASGFHQIPVHNESIERTAFVTPDGQFEFLTMPFGLKNAPSVFQRAIMKALGDLAHDYVIVYMDDVMIVASSLNEAFERLEVVVQVLSKAGFSFNISKCAFMKSCTEYLGFVVQAGEVKPNPRKVEALTNLPPPQTITQLRQFIGLASYFRMFIENFSLIMKPLYFLTSNKTLKWENSHEEIRQKVIKILTCHPVLMIFDPQYPIELHTDASAAGYGAILIHKINGKPHPVEYYSKVASPEESRYHSFELETLAVVRAVKHFSHYLTDRQFTICTDCNALKSSYKKKDLSSRANRLWADIQSYDFDIVYKEGKRMAHVDFLSRNPLSKDISFCNKIEQKFISLAQITDEWLLAEQQRDPEICEIIQKINSEELSADVAKTFELRKGILYRVIQRNCRNKVLAIVPRALRWAVINHVHEAIMHLGWVKTLNKIYEYYWFEKMSKYVRKFVENCMTCKMTKSMSGKIQAELHPIPKVEIPWHTIHVDLTGKLSGKNDVKEYVLVQICAFTKFVFLHHTLHLNAENCIKALRSSISLFGVPSRIIADQGRCFAGKDFSQFCSTQNIKLHLIATGSSRANGQVERVMSTLKNLLSAVEASNRSWQDALEEVQLALNSTINQITTFSPLELLIGKQARPYGLLTPSVNEPQIDKNELRSIATKNMAKSAAYSKKRFDKNKAKILKFKVGDLVLWKCEERHQTKLDPKFKGPFKIVKVLDNDRYMLSSMKDKRTYKVVHEFLRKLPECDPNDVMESENEELCENSESNDEKENANVLAGMACDALQ